MNRIVMASVAGCVLALAASSLAAAQVSTITANPDTVTTPPGMSVAIGVLANDVDTTTTILPSTLVLASAPAYGQAVADPASGTITYTPIPGFVGADSFTYEVCDALGACADGMVTVVVANPTPAVPTSPAAGWPSANNDTVGVNEDQPATLPVLANDGDVAGTLVPSTLTIVTGAKNGTATANADGTITYTPNGGYYGPDGLVYQICDNQVVSMCSSAQVTIGVNATPATQAATPVPTAPTTPVATASPATTPATTPAPATTPVATSPAPLPPNTGSGVQGSSSSPDHASLALVALGLVAVASVLSGFVVGVRQR